MKSASVLLGVVAIVIAAGGGCQSTPKEAASKTAIAKPDSNPDSATPPSHTPVQPQASSPHGAKKPPAADQDDVTDSPTGLRIQFGIMPADYSDPKKGILVGDVTPGTGAADAGIKTDDRLMTWNGQEITDVYKWMDLMAKHKPGDVVTVGVLREGKTIPMKVTLKARE